MEPNTFPPRSHFQARNEMRQPHKFGSPSTSRVSSPSYSSHFLNQPTRSKFIGSFIHEYSFDSRVKQRPSKRARQRIQKRLARLELEDRGNKGSPESGYDTTSGDCQTPGLSSPEKRTFTLKEDQKAPKRKNQEQTSNVPKDNKEPTTQARITEPTSHARTTSVSSVSNLITDQTLRRLLKDLHRCEVSLVKYEGMLSDKCREGKTHLHEVFSSLRRHIDTRESDLRQELTNVTESAATILERRKNTAVYLRQAAEQVSLLEDAQITELKQQIKQFVTDRRVDEEIGTITRFQADPDDILPHILGFGKVNNVRHLYTEWEENPGEAIEMSKHRLSFSITNLGSHRFSSSSLSEANSSPTHSVKSDTSDSHANSSAFAEPGQDVIAAPAKPNDKPQKTQVDVGKETDREKILTSKKVSAQTDTCKPQPKACGDEKKVKQSEERMMDTKPVRTEPESNPPGTESENRPPRTESESRPPRMMSEGRPAKAEAKTKKDKPKLNSRTPKTEVTKEEVKEEKPPSEQEEPTEDKDADQQSEKKLSASELILKQSRVRESLKMQGVFLYDPITGEGPPPTPLPPATPTDPNAGVDQEAPPSPVFRKKKTPTQLRRERKKRQKERERRQSELERKLREDSSKSNSLSSLDYKTPEISTTDKSSGADEEASVKDNWSCISTGQLAAEDRDASGEGSENEMTSLPPSSEHGGGESAQTENVPTDQADIQTSERSDISSKELNTNSLESDDTSQVPTIHEPTTTISSPLIADKSQTTSDTTHDSPTSSAENQAQVDSNTSTLVQTSVPCEDISTTSTEQPTPLQTVPALKQLATIAAGTQRTTITEAPSVEKVPDEQEEKEGIDEVSHDQDEQPITDQYTVDVGGTQEGEDEQSSNDLETESSPPAVSDASPKQVVGSFEAVEKSITDSIVSSHASALAREE